MTARQPRPDNCVKCERPFRPYRTPAAEYPGTVMHGGKGICNGCRLNPNAAPREPMPCPGDCGRMLRPYRSSLDEFPGTLSRSGKGGMCKMCRPRNEPNKQPSVTEEARTKYITRELVAYMRWRGRDISQLGLAS